MDDEDPPKPPEYKIPRLGWKTPEERAQKHWESFFDGFGGFPPVPEAFAKLDAERTRLEEFRRKTEPGSMADEDAGRQIGSVRGKIAALVETAKKSWVAKPNQGAAVVKDEEAAARRRQAWVDKEIAEREARIARAKARAEVAEMEAAERESAESTTPSQEAERARIEAQADRIGIYLRETRGSREALESKVVPLRREDPGVEETEPGPSFPWQKRLRWTHELKGLPPKKVLSRVSDLWPKCWLSILNGDGGSGKSTLVTQLFSALSGGTPIFGKATLPTKPLLISTEEDDEIAIRRLNGTPDVGQFPIFNLLDWPGPIELAATLRSGRVEAQPFLGVLREMIGDLRPELVGLDHVGDLFFINENSKSEVSVALRLLQALRAEFRASFEVDFILTQHMSKVGMASGRRDAGTPQWHNKSRWRAALYPPGVGDEAAEDERLAALKKQARVLEIVKDQEGGMDGLRLSLLRQTWHFVEEKGEIGRAVARSLADGLLEFALRHLPTCDGRRLPLALKAPGGMVSQFMAATGLKGGRGDEVYKCLLELISAGKLGQVSEGPASRLRSYVVLL